MFKMIKLISTVVCLAAFVCSPSRAQDRTVDFEKEVLPILEDVCWHCHGEDEQEAGLRLDGRRYLLKGGDSGLAAVVPNDPGKSYLITAIKHLDEDVIMPPDDDQLSESEINLIATWIKEGAYWPGQMEDVADSSTDHWSFQPIQRPQVPESSFVSNPIDKFLLDKLQANNLNFSKPADPRTLIRRTSIVLTGLPPTPEEADQFIREFNSDSEAAFERLVDRLLESPQFGERWAQHWLDVIRWAESNGSESNLYRKNAWVYRDYVIRSFNEDKPYDQFVQEQIAGDSMGTGEATGFLVAGPHVPAATVGREPSAIRQARADRIDEVMQTVGASVMGVTMGCARCHNHKFDPISIQDYYAMTAVFQDVEFGSRYPEYSETHPLNIRGKELWKQLSAQRKKLKPNGGWEENWGAFREVHFNPITTKAIRIQFKTPNVGLDELEVFGPETNNLNLALERSGTDVSGFPEKGNENRNPVERINDGEYGTMAWRARVDKDANDKPWIQFDFSEPQTINRLRLSSNREYFYETDYLEKKPYLPKYQFDMSILKDDGSWQPWVGSWYINNKLMEKYPERQGVVDEIQSLIGQLSEQGPRPSFVGRFVKPGKTFVLHRGSPENPRDEVEPAGPVVLQGELNLGNAPSGPQRRHLFAKWITEKENPLTSRVMVNRIWHHIFGQGIVTTTSDFGKAGAPPSHPELLDWLASEFVEPTSRDAKPWSVKSLIRMMVMSRGFRQASLPDDLALRVDSGSALLWRYPPRRVEAEVIRDSILLASGSLNSKVGGRSYRIHNEKKTYAQWQVTDNFGPETWRRMIYQERMRRVDDQMFTAFDFPDCGQVRAKRPVSTTPLQALNLLNSQFVMNQAKLISERASNEADGDLEGTIKRCFELLLDREPSPEELEDCLVVAGEKGVLLVCRALINSNEFAFLQ